MARDYFYLVACASRKAGCYDFFCRRTSGARGRCDALVILIWALLVGIIACAGGCRIIDSHFVVLRCRRRKITRKGGDWGVAEAYLIVGGNPDSQPLGYGYDFQVWQRGALGVRYHGATAYLPSFVVVEISGQVEVVCLVVLQVQGDRGRVAVLGGIQWICNCGRGWYHSCVRSAPSVGS